MTINTHGVPLDALIPFLDDPARLENVAEAVADLQKQESDLKQSMTQTVEKARGEAEAILTAARSNADVMMEEAGEEIDRRKATLDEQKRLAEETHSTQLETQQEIARAQTEITDERVLLTRIRAENERLHKEGTEALEESNAKILKLRECIDSIGV